MCFMIGLYESDKISMSLCLFKPFGCILMCIISEMTLLYQEASLSKMKNLSQSNSYIRSKRLFLNIAYWIYSNVFINLF